MDKYRDYIRDLSIILIETALKSKEEANSKSDDNEISYSTGYLMAFHRVISLMQQQAESFQIPLEEIGLEKIDPDIDLT